MIAALMFAFVAMLGVAAWVYGITLMLHHCEDLSTHGLSGWRLRGFCLGAIANWTGLALVLFSGMVAGLVFNGIGGL